MQDPGSSAACRSPERRCLGQLDGQSLCMSFAAPSQLHLSGKPGGRGGMLDAGQRARVEQITALAEAASIVGDYCKWANAAQERCDVE
jgi:hypothetical protein